MFYAKLPIETVYHPDYECYDVIADLVTRQHSDDECVVLSNDTDFIQLYATHKDVSIYSPVKKEYLISPDYNYVHWKSLVGDSSDNIKGVPRVGKKTASKILEEGLLHWLDENPGKAEIFDRNVKLISFADLSDKFDDFVITESEADYDEIRKEFNEMDFASITRDKTWDKFVGTFTNIGQGVD